MEPIMQKINMLTRLTQHDQVVIFRRAALYGLSIVAIALYQKVSTQIYSDYLL